jgi:hypothetical protein
VRNCLRPRRRDIDVEPAWIISIIAIVIVAVIAWKVFEGRD